MKLNNNTIIFVVFLGCLSLTGCTSTASFFRNRDFDYSREAVYQNKPLNVPKSVSVNPNINPALVMPETGELHFDEGTQIKAENALQPPGLNRAYNLDYIQQQQMLKVNTKLSSSDDNQAILLIYEPVKLSWHLLLKILHEKIPEITLEDSDAEKSQFTIKDNHTQKQYGIVLTAIKNQPKQTKLVLLDLAQNPIVSKDGNTLITLIDHKLKREIVTQEMLMASGYGFIESARDFKYQLIFSGKTATLVFVGDRQKIEAALETAIKQAKFTYLLYNKEENTIAIKDPLAQTYLLYLYDYTQLGGVFSDLTNWRHFFKTEQQELRVAVFNMDKNLLPKKMAEPILMKIGQHIPL